MLPAKFEPTFRHPPVNLTHVERFMSLAEYDCGRLWDAEVGEANVARLLSKAVTGDLFLESDCALGRWLDRSFVGREERASKSELGLLDDHVEGAELTPKSGGLLLDLGQPGLSLTPG
jgi:hypothetical protein